MVPEQYFPGMESPTNNATSMQSKDGVHTPLPADALTYNTASSDNVTDNVVTCDTGLTRDNPMDASLPLGTTDSMCDYDMLGSVDGNVHSPDNQNTSSVIFVPSGESNSGLLVDLNTDNDAYDTSTASLMSQSPANDIRDPFDPLPQSGGEVQSGGLDLASEMYVGPVTAGLVQPMIPDTTNALTGVADTSDCSDLHCENPDPNTAPSLEGKNEEVVQLSKDGQEYDCLEDRQDNIIFDDTQSNVMDDNKNNSAIVGEAGEKTKDAEVMDDEPLTSNVTEQPTDLVTTAHVTDPEGEGRVYGDDLNMSSEALVAQQIVTDQGEGYDCDEACISPLPETLPHVPQPQCVAAGEETICVTTGQEMSEVKDNIGPTEEMQNGCVSPSMPLQLMAVSRHIVSAVQENAFASLQQLNQPTVEDTSTQQVEHAMPTEDTSAVAMETPAVIDNEAVQGKSEATQATKTEQRDTDGTAAKDVSNTAEAKKSRSASDKAPTNNSTPVGKTLQPKPPPSTAKKSIPRKQAASSLKSPRMHPVKQGACVFLLAWQALTITCRNSKSMIIMSTIHV